MEHEPTSQPGSPSPEAQSWGTFVSIVIIILMIIVGAFYSWNKRIAEQNVLNASASTSQQ